MKDNELFQQIMDCIWDGKAEVPFTARALANTVRGRQRCNEGNALDVLQVVFADAKTSFRISEFDDSTVICDVVFSDGSRVLVECPRGIGSWIEPNDTVSHPADEV